MESGTQLNPLQTIWARGSRNESFGIVFSGLFRPVLFSRFSHIAGITLFLCTTGYDVQNLWGKRRIPELRFWVCPLVLGKGTACGRNGMIKSSVRKDRTVPATIKCVVIESELYINVITCTRGQRPKR